MSYEINGKSIKLGLGIIYRALFVYMKRWIVSVGRNEETASLLKLHDHLHYNVSLTKNVIAMYRDDILSDVNQVYMNYSNSMRPHRLWL